MSAADAPTPEPDPAIARAERRLAMLGRLAEIGMALAEGLLHENPKDVADDFARISRAVRLTLALEEATDRTLAELKAGGFGPREPREAAPAKPDKPAEPAKPRDPEALITNATLAAARACAPDMPSYERACDAIWERLWEDEAYQRLEERPVRETVERLCHDLCLEPDWSQWDDGFEAWKPGYIPKRAGCSAFNQRSSVPIREPGTRREYIPPSRRSQAGP